MVPRPHQQEAIEFAEAALGGGPARCIAQLPTGSGKTLVECLVARKWLIKGGKVVILTPSSVTVGKLYIDLKRAGLMPSMEMGTERAKRESRLVVGTYATAWNDFQKHCEPNALLILDEAHHVNNKAQSNMSIYQTYRYIFGLTASPWSKSCLELFEYRHTYSLSDSIKDGINCDFEIVDNIPIDRGKYQLVYCPSNYQAPEIARTLPHSDWVLYDSDNRNERINRFMRGEIGTMVVNRMLMEGFDLPAIKRVWINRVTRSPIAAYQMLGRALRPFNGQKAICSISDRHTRATLRHALTLAGYN